MKFVFLVYKLSGFYAGCYHYKLSKKRKFEQFVRVTEKITTMAR